MNQEEQPQNDTQSNLPAVRKNPTKILLSILCAMVVIAGLIGGYIYLQKGKKTIPTMPVIEEDRHLVMQDLQVTVSPLWTVTQEDNRILLSLENARIVISHAYSPYYYTTNSFATLMKKDLQQKKLEILEDLSEIAIHDNTWEQLSSMQNGRKTWQLFFAKDYDTYSFTYYCIDNSYENHWKEASQIYHSLTIDTQQDEIDAQRAKEILMGEWDWGINGYLVIQEDQFYLYPNASQNSRDVCYGTYEVNGKIKTYSSGYQEGLSFTGKIEKKFRNGIEQKLHPGSDIHLTFTPNEDGTYWVQDSNNTSKGMAQKILPMASGEGNSMQGKE